MKPHHLRPGYAEMEAASAWLPNSENWESFLRDILDMPLSMLPAVQYAIKRKTWRTANDPLEQVKVSAKNWEMRRAQSASEGK